MICYKDKTFCNFWVTCKQANDCDRKSTKEIEENSIKKGLPLSLFTDKPNCYEEKE